MAENLTFCEDCMAVMARYPDKYFDLAVVDPPYGGGSSQSVQVERERERRAARRSR
ncbi:MAG: site-specific DNA-methyltransferase [Oscillospiraceae bacterium]|nr:site-specific DNA-methyltransferase [Oscillospiraceae bacterium]